MDHSTGIPVPRLWPDSTIVCIGSGPSLNVSDVMLCKVNGFKLFAVNDAYRLCDGQADAIYSAEHKWWYWNQSLLVHPDPLKFVLCGNPYRIPLWHQYAHWDTLHPVRQTGERGFEDDPLKGIRHGGHSGYGAINIAAHLGAKRIILLGYDMMQNPQGLHHFFGDHQDGSHLAYEARRKLYSVLFAELYERGIELVNATPTSMIPTVPRKHLIELI